MRKSRIVFECQLADNKIFSTFGPFRLMTNDFELISDGTFGKQAPLPSGSPDTCFILSASLIILISLLHILLVSRMSFQLFTNS